MAEEHDQQRYDATPLPPSPAHALNPLVPMRENPLRHARRGTRGRASAV